MDAAAERMPGRPSEINKSNSKQIGSVDFFFFSYFVLVSLFPSRYQWMQSLQQEVRAAVRCLRRSGHRFGQPLRRPLRRPQVLHVFVALLRNGPFLRRIHRGKTFQKKKKKGKKKDPDPVTQIRHSRCKNSTLVCSTKPFRCYSAMLIEPRLMIYRVKFNRAPYITF